MKLLSFTAESLAQTEAFGRQVADQLFAGAVVALIGPLGAGKTSFARAIGGGLGIADPSSISSPTFVLIHEYEARLPIFHFDAYRLRSENDFADLGVDEYFQSDGICLVEWADKVPNCLPRDHLEIRITIVGEMSRHFEVSAHGSRHEPLVRQLAAITLSSAAFDSSTEPDRFE